MLVLFLISTVYLLKAQQVDSLNITTLKTADYTAVDNVVLKMKKRYKNIPDLAKSITAPFNTDEEKVRAIFRWITENVAYDVAALKLNNQTMNVRYKTNDPKNVIEGKWEDSYFKYASKVLSKKKAICEGYATLFYELCRLNNIKCEVVIGYADETFGYKTGKNKIVRYKKRKDFKTNHAWNKVFINNQWYYLDATWASGFCDERLTKFTKHLDNYYYLTPEDELFPTHAENKKQTKRRNELVGNY